MNLDEYKTDAMKKDNYEILLENDRLVNELYRLEDSLIKDRKRYSSVFSRGRNDFRKLEKNILESIEEIMAKTIILAQITYSKRD